MPRMYGGHTELGSHLNQNSQRTEYLDIEKVNTRRAIIHKSYKGQYIFYMKMFDNNGNLSKITGPIPIVGAPGDLSSRYGAPSELENNWEVLITYRGTSINRGTAQITKSVGTTIGGRTEEVEQTNQLMVKGTAFAPPGPGA